MRDLEISKRGGTAVKIVPDQRLLNQRSGFSFRVRVKRTEEELVIKFLKYSNEKNIS